MFYELILALMIILPITWLKVKNNYSWEKIRAELLPAFQGWRKELIGTILITLLLILGFFLLIGALSMTPYNDLEKVNDSVKSQIANEGMTLFIGTLLIVLFIEEFFFRAFLLNRFSFFFSGILLYFLGKRKKQISQKIGSVLGLILSTLVFMIAHFGYGSIAELVGAFFLGLILAYWFKKNNSIIQNYFGHLLYDFFAIAIYLMF